MEVRHLRSDELQHHGVKGQKWGVRRYQNPDGTLTAAGRRRYLGKIDKKKLDYTDYNRAYQKNKELGSILLDKQDDEYQSKRIENAADTALRALDRNDDYGMGETGYYRTESESSKKSSRFWLTYEDQTIGYAEIADMANQGKSSKEIWKTIKEASKAYDDIRESGEKLVNQVKDKYLPPESKNDWDTDRYIKSKVLKAINNSEALFDLNEFYTTYEYSDYFKSKYDRFVDACVEEAEIKNKK